MSDLIISRLSKSYLSGSQPTPVLRDVSITIPGGSFAVVIGKSGSGKSTLLSLIAGLDRPDGGTIAFENKTLSGMSPDSLADFRLHRIGLVFQFFNFLPTLTIEENISLPAFLASGSSKKKIGEKNSETKANCRELLASLSIEHIRTKFPHEVSGGELQRSAVARALINRPALVLADEPTGNLDAENSASVFQLLLRLTKERGATLVMATHELDFVGSADLSLELRNGAAHAME